MYCVNSKLSSNLYMDMGLGGSMLGYNSHLVFS